MVRKLAHRVCTHYSQMLWIPLLLLSCLLSPLCILLCRLTAEKLRTLTSCSHVSLWKWRQSTVWSSWTLMMMHSETFPSSIPILMANLEFCSVCTRIYLAWPAYYSLLLAVFPPTIYNQHERSRPYPSNPFSFNLFPSAPKEIYLR